MGVLKNGQVVVVGLVGADEAEAEREGTDVVGQLEGGQWKFDLVEELNVDPEVLRLEKTILRELSKVSPNGLDKLEIAKIQRYSPRNEPNTSIEFSSDPSIITTLTMLRMLQSLESVFSTTIRNISIETLDGGSTKRIVLTSLPQLTLPSA